MRAFGDGFISLLLPVYLTALGYGPVAVGVVTTATMVGAVGSFAAVLPETLGFLFPPLVALQAMFLLYGLLGLVVLALYRLLPSGIGKAAPRAAAPLKESRRIVLTLTALFSIDAFGGG